MAQLSLGEDMYLHPLMSDLISDVLLSKIRLH